MPTDDDTPVAPVQGDSFASLTANVGDTPLGSTGEEEFVENYDLTYDDNDAYTLSEKMVHHCGGHILPVHWSACKAVLAFYAGSRVSKSKTSKKPEMERECLEIYYNAIEELDVDHVNKDAREFFCHSFQKKEEPMPAHSLWRYYYDSRAKIRRDVQHYFPKELMTMKSGRGFHESWNEIYVKAYRLEMGKCKVTKGGAPKYTAEEIEVMYPPRHWEYTKSPWHFGLLIKIFRRDPQLALHVASVMSDPLNAPVSRAELRRQKQVKAREKQNHDNKENRAGPPHSINIANAKTSSSLSCSSTSSGRAGQSAAANVCGGSELSDSPAEEKRMNDARVLMSTTHANQHMLNRRMGKLEEIERSMAALEKMKAYIPEEMYAAKMRSAFASVPVFGTYEAEVAADITKTRVRNKDNYDDTVRQHDTVKKSKTVAGDNDSFVTCGIEDREYDNNDRAGSDIIDDEDDDYFPIDDEDGFPIEDYFPIIDRTGKMIGMNYSLKHVKKRTQDGRPMRYLWENFMDRFDSDDEHYPVLDNGGKMISLGTISKKARVPCETEGGTEE